MFVNRTGQGYRRPAVRKFDFVRRVLYGLIESEVISVRAIIIFRRERMIFRFSCVFFTRFLLLQAATRSRQLMIFLLFIYQSVRFDFYFFRTARSLFIFVFMYVT